MGDFIVANEVDEVTFMTLSEYMIEKLQPGMTIGFLAKLVAKQTRMKAQQVSHHSMHFVAPLPVSKALVGSYKSLFV